MTIFMQAVSNLCGGLFFHLYGDDAYENIKGWDEDCPDFKGIPTKEEVEAEVARLTALSYQTQRADEYPEIDYPTINDGKYKGVIGVGGLLLARISTELVESRKEYFNNLTKEKDEAIENDLLKEQHPGVTIDRDRQTRVTFGGTKKS